MEAESRVLDLLPTALVVRTSAFFGPWDVSNFLARLFHALDSGATFDAPADTTVSPTYVPDLVNASLDLLLDRERGLWHLTNDGAATWFTFGREAAARSGRPVERIVAVEGKRAWPGAQRPRYSALTSRRGRLLPTLDTALAAYLKALATAGPTERGRCAS
jgi:dTDP-4-dehydrorhamnose reductase